MTGLSTAESRACLVPHPQKHGNASTASAQVRRFWLLLLHLNNLGARFQPTPQPSTPDLRQFVTAGFGTWGGRGMIPALRLGFPGRSRGRSEWPGVIAAARADGDPRNLAMLWGRAHISVLPFLDPDEHGAPESALPWSLLMGTIP